MATAMHLHQSSEAAMDKLTPNKLTRPFTPPAIEVVAAAAEGCDALVAVGVIPAGVRR